MAKIMVIGGLVGIVGSVIGMFVMVSKDHWHRPGHRHGGRHGGDREAHSGWYAEGGMHQNHRGKRDLHRDFDFSGDHHHQEEFGGEDFSMKKGKGWEKYREVLSQRKVDNGVMKVMLLTLVTGFLILIAGKIGMWAQWIQKNENSKKRLRRMFKKTAIILGITSVLLLFVQLPASLRIVRDVRDMKMQREGQREHGKGKRFDFNGRQEKIQKRDRFQNDVVDINKVMDQMFADMNRMQNEMSFGGNQFLSLKDMKPLFVDELPVSRGKGGRDGRRLNAFDVFDFVKNAIDNGVNKVKQEAKKIAKEPIGQMANNFKNKIEKEIDAKFDKKVEEEQQAEDEQKYTQDDIEQALEIVEEKNAFGDEEMANMDQLEFELTDWMNKYAESMGTPAEELLDSFAVALDSVEQEREDEIPEAPKHTLQSAHPEAQPKAMPEQKPVGFVFEFSFGGMPQDSQQE